MRNLYGHGVIWLGVGVVTLLRMFVVFLPQPPNLHVRPPDRVKMEALVCPAPMDRTASVCLTLRVQTAQEVT